MRSGELTPEIVKVDESKSSIDYDPGFETTHEITVIRFADGSEIWIFRSGDCDWRVYWDGDGNLIGDSDNGNCW